MASKNEPSGQSKKRTFPRPLENRYGAMLTAAIFALAPFIVVTTSFAFFSRQIGSEIGLGRMWLEIIRGFSIAGYAFGALLGGDLINRVPQRKLFLLCETGFVAGAAMAAAAHSAALFGVGAVLQGFGTGLMLVVALPPVIRRFSAAKMPITSAVVNIGFFGATSAGPVIGGAVAAAHVWRWFYAGLAIIGSAVIVLAALSLPDQEAMNPDMPFDWHAISLALGATFLSFFAAGSLVAKGFGSVQFALPLAIGVACFAGLIVVQYHKSEPLSPVKPMWNTVPVVGTLVAMIGGGVFITFLTLIVSFETEALHWAPLRAGLSFWPLLVGTLISAIALGLLIRTRYIPLFTLAGMLLLVGGGGLLLNISSATPPIVLMAAAGLLGTGAGATVSPALWLAGFSLPSKLVGRTFALVELVRSVPDFILAPVVVEVAHVASADGGLTPHGLSQGIWYTFLLTVSGTAFCFAIYAAGKTGLPKPDLDGWLSGKQPAMKSPPLGAGLGSQHS